MEHIPHYKVVIHIVFALVSYIAFLLAFVSGIVYLVEEKHIKKKVPGVLQDNTPSLEVLDRINYWAIASGFILFTVGAVYGVLLARPFWGRTWSWDPKEIWTAITWCIYAFLLWVRATSALRGRRLILLSILGFLFIIFTFIGVNYILGGSHVYI